MFTIYDDKPAPVSVVCVYTRICLSRPRLYKALINVFSNHKSPIPRRLYLRRRRKQSVSASITLHHLIYPQ
jgi:hypothetical protein